MEQQQHAQSDAGYRNTLIERLRALSRGRSLTRPVREVRPLGFGGLLVALLFFWMSLTPSLLPRAWLFQGIVSGLSAVIGYGIGSAISALVLQLARAERMPAYQRSAWMVLAGAAVLGSSVLLWQAHRWQNELRALVGLDDASAFSGLGILLVAAITGGVVLVGARLVRSLTRWLIHEVDRIAPRWVAIAAGVLLAAVVVVGFFQDVVWGGVVGAMNQAASVTNGTTSVGTVPPAMAERSGGPDSLVAWNSLGRQGRDFVSLGPTVRDLEAFHGTDCCAQPIRVYVGLDSAPSAEQRAALAVRELERTGAFERDVLGIFTATGTGWINPKVADSLEYLHRGDTAEVSMQYSFLPSWLSFLVDQTKAEEAGQALIGAVLRRVDELPPAERPTVLVFGESLGSYGTEQAFDSLADLRAKVDGALLAGPTFANPIWDQLIDGRVHRVTAVVARAAGRHGRVLRAHAGGPGRRRRARRRAAGGVPAERVGSGDVVEPGAGVPQAGLGRVAGGAGPAAGIPLVPDRDVLPGGDGPGELAGGAGGTRALLRVERGGRVGGGVEAGRLERRTDATVAADRAAPRRVRGGRSAACMVAGVAAVSLECALRSTRFWRALTWHGSAPLRDGQ